MTEDEGPRPGAWARSGELVGLVAGRDGDQVTLFDPAERRMTRVPLAGLRLLPAAAVRVTLTAELPLAHGLAESGLRRWVASLADPVVRERAYAALAEAGLDEGAALPTVEVEVQPSPTEGALCLCGARTPAPDGAEVACHVCGRSAVSRPAPSPGAGGPEGAAEGIGAW